MRKSARSCVGFGAESEMALTVPRLIVISDSDDILSGESAFRVALFHLDWEIIQKSAQNGLQSA